LYLHPHDFGHARDYAAGLGKRSITYIYIYIFKNSIFNQCILTLIFRLVFPCFLHTNLDFDAIAYYITLFNHIYNCTVHAYTHTRARLSRSRKSVHLHAENGSLLRKSCCEIWDLGQRLTSQKLKQVATMDTRKEYHCDTDMCQKPFLISGTLE